VVEWVRTLVAVTTFSRSDEAALPCIGALIFEIAAPVLPWIASVTNLVKQLLPP
jgi:hypothetical protein